jgi:hypothetical protein
LNRIPLARAVAFLILHGPVSISRVAAVSRMPLATVRQFIEQLHEAGMVRPVGVEELGKRGVKPNLWEWVR